jgi:hypothetical protein
MITMALRGFPTDSVAPGMICPLLAGAPRSRFAATTKMHEGGVVTESLRDIRIFVAAYEERSFTAAAVREHATQSGVSQHIRKLEEGFRVKLFSRGKGQVAPTPAADAYSSRCIQILRNIESSNEAMRCSREFRATCSSG